MKLLPMALSLLVAIGMPGTAMCQKIGPAAIPTAEPAVVARALAELCPAGHLTKDRNGHPNGCAVCPKQTDVDTPWAPTWILKAALKGHFISASDDDLLLGGSGCESHSMNLGGTYIFRLRHGMPALLQYLKGVRTDDCKVLRTADHRDLLVCMDEWGAWGTVLCRIFTVSFTPGGQAQITPVFTTEDNVATCGIGPTEEPPGGVQRSRVRDFRLIRAADGNVNLVITATLGKAHLTRQQAKQCDTLLPRGVSAIAEQLSIPEMVERIVFHFDSATFQVAPGSRIALSRFPKPVSPL